MAQKNQSRADELRPDSIVRAVSHIFSDEVLPLLGGEVVPGREMLALDGDFAVSSGQFMNFFTSGSAREDQKMPFLQRLSVYWISELH